MTVDVPLKAIEPTDILDALGKYAALHQQRVASKYAEPNAQQNLARVKALIEGQNLTNQTSQLKMPYVAPRQQAEIRKLLAGAGKEEAETGYMGTKYAQAARRLGIDERKNSPEMLDSLRKYRDALRENMPTKNLTAFGKGILEQKNIEQGLLPTGTVNIPGQQKVGAIQGVQGGQGGSNQPGQSISQGQGMLRSQGSSGQSDQSMPQGQGGAPNISPEAQHLINQYKLKRIKDTTDAALRAAFPQIKSIDNTMASIPFNTVAQFYGPQGQARAAQQYAYTTATGKMTPEYKAYKDFLSVKGPSLVAQMRQFLKDSVTPGAQEHIRGIVFPKKWTDNPALALNQFNALQDLYHIEKEARVSAANEPSLFEGKESVQQSSFKAPTFKNEQEFNQWKQSASHDEKEAYKKHLGIK